MTLDRRGFLLGATASAVVSGTRAFAAEAEPDLTFGVLSDVHLNKPGDEDTFLAALAYFRDNGADGVVIAGDIADTGRIEQLKRCGECWKKVFPGNKGLCGRHVEKLFVYGNHDTQAWTWGADEKKRADKAYLAQCIHSSSQDAIWEDAFGEKYEPVWLKTVKGYAFVGAHWPAMGDAPAFLKAHAAELRSSHPFFYIQHAHPKDTCFGAWAWGRDNGASTEALSAFPNAVAFSGHSHYTLTDERTVWQGAFTSINTASLRYASVDYSLRENINGNGHGYKGETRKHAMDQIATGTGRQGMLIRVFGSELDIERRDFVRGKSLGDNWRISIPGGEDATYAARAAKRSAPQFAAGAQVKAEVANGKVTLSFPPARTIAKCRVYEYEVTATLVEDEVDLVQAQRRMMAPDFFMPETAEGAPGSFVFRCDELPCKGHYVFSVRPVECFGKKGEPISVKATVS